MPRDFSRDLSRFIRAWLCVFAAVFFIGPIAGMIAHQIRGPDGGTHATLLLSLSPLAGLAVAVVLGAIIVATILAARAAASVNVGLFCGGIVAAWAAARLGRVDLVILASPRSPGGTLALEGMLGLLVLGCISVMLKRISRGAPVPALTWRWLGATIAGICAGGAAVWLVAVEPSRGQVIAAAAAAGIVSAAVMRMVLLGSPTWMLLWPCALLSVLAPILSALVMDDPVIAVRDGELFRLGGLQTFDWLAGALLGVPVGAVWTESVALRASGSASEIDTDSR
ncbi:MAG: hypothetical protein AAGB48_00320 [Planctomycetota bacterium]